MSSASALDQLCAAACDTGTGVEAPATAQACQIQVLEVDAFASVHDLIHTAILSSRGAASLKEVYEVCQTNGRIAYKRAGGSRLITSNDHWKSQIRHALYTSDRFERVPGNSDLWQVTAAYADTQPQMAKVLVRADEGTAGAAAQPLSLPAPHQGSAGGGGGGALASRPVPSPASRRKPGARVAAAGKGEDGGRGSRGARGAKSRSASPDLLAASKRRRAKRRRRSHDSEEEDKEEEGQELEEEAEEEEEEELGAAGISRTAATAAAAAALGLPRRGAARAVAALEAGEEEQRPSGSVGRGSVRSAQWKAPPPAPRPGFPGSHRDEGPAASGYNSSPGESGAGHGAPAPPVTGPRRRRVRPSVAAAVAADPSPMAAAAPTVPLGARAPRGSRGPAYSAVAVPARPASGPGGSLGTPDPSLLRWGSTGLRSCLQQPSASSLQAHHSAAGGPPGTAHTAAAVTTAPRHRRTLSAEAESPPLGEIKAVGRRVAAAAEEWEEADAGRPAKRQAAPPFQRQLDVTLTPSQIERPVNADIHTSPPAPSPLTSPLDSWTTAMAARQAQQQQQLAASRGMPPGMLVTHHAAGAALPTLSPMPFPAMMSPFFPHSPALMMAAATPFLSAHVVQQQQAQQSAAAQQAQTALAQVQQAIRALQQAAGAQQWQQAQQAQQQQQQQQQQAPDRASSDERK